MYESTLTDWFIKQGLIDPFPVPSRLDGDGSALILDGEQQPQNEEKSRE